MSGPAESAAFERILDFLRQTRGFDFTAYKRSSLLRRIRKRMETIGIHEVEAYLAHLEVHTGEFPALFNSILINVTRFFRDAEVWEDVGASVIRPLLAARPADAPVRIWSAGCASGQEAYTAAILLAEQLGPDAFRERVKIYATDVDDDALAQARHATYTQKQIEDVPEALLARYFERVGDWFTVKRELRRGVIFGHHDLLQDAPISRIDVLFCRNTLMYFTSDAQARVMSRFYYSIGAGGFLVLGRAEMLFSHATLFEPVDLKRRIFKTAPTSRAREIALDMGPEPRFAFADVARLESLQNDLTQSKQDLDTAYEELQSTNEEMETTNEELQSTVEELETTNEELQSTNEELETMNEELQSTNEELQTMNAELRTRGLDLHTSNAFLESILTSLRSAVVVLDRELRIEVWNAGAVNLWGLREDEAVGSYFFSIDIGLPVQSLDSPVKDVLSSRTESATTVLAAMSRKGRALQCRVTTSPVFRRDREIGGVLILMDAEPVVA